MANLLKNLKPKAQVSKNGFDLSRKHVFSSRLGLIDTPLFVETVPNDYFEIDMASLHRTMTLNTAAFLRGKFRYDFFFVPYVQLWHPFNQFITQREDRHSSLQKSHNYVPVIDLGKLLKLGIDTYEGDAVMVRDSSDIFGFDFLHHLVRTLDLMGYGNFYHLVDRLENGDTDLAYEIAAQYEGKYVNLFRAAAFQHIWYDWYRNKYFDTEPYITLDQSTDYVTFFNFDDLDCRTFANSILEVEQANYTRIFGLFSARYAPWKKDLLTGSLPGQQFGAVSNVVLGGDSSISLNGIGVLDNLVTSAADGRYYGNYSSQSLPSNIVPTTNSSGTGLMVNRNGDVYTVNHDHKLYGNVPVSVNGSVSVSSSFDVLSLRKAEMLQIWKERTLRAGNMTDDNFEAHYGTSPYYDSDENVNFLGSFEAPLQINAVESTAFAGQSQDKINGMVGDLAATGTAVSRGEKIKFDCRDFGVIVCCAYFVPESEYNSTMIDKANRLHEQFDFFTPEFQNIGLEPIQRVDYDANLQTDALNEVIGFSPRYWQYKTALDKVFGEFSKFNYRLASVSPTLQTFNGSLIPWVSPRYERTYNGQNAEVDGSAVRPVASFYVDPAVYNNVFGITVDSTAKTDCFLNNVFFDIKAIRPMSELGLPQF